MVYWVITLDCFKTMHVLFTFFIKSHEHLTFTWYEHSSFYVIYLFMIIHRIELFYDTVCMIGNIKLLYV